MSGNDALAAMEKALEELDKPRAEVSLGRLATVAAIAALAIGGLLYLSFNPTVSEDFLFLYFGITSALAVGVWSTFVLAGRHDKSTVFVVTVLFEGAAFGALFAAVVGTGSARIPLDFSISVLIVGMLLQSYHSFTHWESNLERELIKDLVRDYEKAKLHIEELERHEMHPRPPQ
jgi:hypothetical protein